MDILLIDNNIIKKSSFFYPFKDFYKLENFNIFLFNLSYFKDIKINKGYFYNYQNNFTLNNKDLLKEILKKKHFQKIILSSNYQNIEDIKKYILKYSKAEIYLLADNKKKKDLIFKNKMIPIFKDDYSYCLSILNNIYNLDLSKYYIYKDNIYTLSLINKILKAQNNPFSSKLASLRFCFFGESTFYGDHGYSKIEYLYKIHRFSYLKDCSCVPLINKIKTLDKSYDAIIIENLESNLDLKEIITYINNNYNSSIIILSKKKYKNVININNIDKLEKALLKVRR